MTDYTSDPRWKPDPKVKAAREAVDDAYTSLDSLSEYATAIAYDNARSHLEACFDALCAAVAAAVAAVPAEPTWIAVTEDAPVQEIVVPVASPVPAETPEAPTMDEDDACVRCLTRKATMETEFMGPLCAECYVEALEGICERKDKEIAEMPEAIASLIEAQRIAIPDSDFNRGIEDSAKLIRAFDPARRPASSTVTRAQIGEFVHQWGPISERECRKFEADLTALFPPGAPDA